MEFKEQKNSKTEIKKPLGIKERINVEPPPQISIQVEDNPIQVVETDQ